jgi:hypothetical protein
MKIRIVYQGKLEKKSLHRTSSSVKLFLIQLRSLLTLTKKRKRERPQKGEFALGNANKDDCRLAIDKDLKQSQSSIGRS